MDKYLSTIWEWRFVIIWVITAIIFVWQMGLQWIKAKAYSLMLMAKKLAKDEFLKSGEAQEIWATEQLYIVLKKLKIPFVTKENLKPYVHKLYIKAKDYLDDGKLNDSIK